MEARRPFICIDFDGVLATYSGWQGEDHYGNPIKGAKEFLQCIQKANIDFIVLTTRNISRVAEWFKKHDLPKPKDVTNTKIPAPVYIDDGALTFNGDFGKLLKDLKNFKPYWKSDSIFKSYFNKR